MHGVWMLGHIHGEGRSRVGNWREYYRPAAIGGDRCAARGYEVVAKAGSSALNAWLSEKTSGSIAHPK